MASALLIGSVTMPTTLAQALVRRLLPPVGAVYRASGALNLSDKLSDKADRAKSAKAQRILGAMALAAANEAGRGCGRLAVDHYHSY